MVALYFGGQGITRNNYAHYTLLCKLYNEILALRARKFLRFQVIT